MHSRESSHFWQIAKSQWREVTLPNDSGDMTQEARAWCQSEVGWSKYFDNMFSSWLQKLWCLFRNVMTPTCHHLHLVAIISNCEFTIFIKINGVHHWFIKKYKTDRQILRSSFWSQDWSWYEALWTGSPPGLRDQRLAWENTTSN